MAVDLAGAMLVALLVVFLVNLAPAFMPPTWSILAFFLIRFDLPLLPLAVGGAMAASVGRLGLALLARRWGTVMVPPPRRVSLSRLGSWIEERARWAPPVAMLLYSFGPIPSNQLFVVAGLARVRLAPIFVAFFGGRLLSYTFWVGLAHQAARRLEDVFQGYWADETFVAVEIGLVAATVAVTLVDWGRVVSASPTTPAG